MKRFAIVAVVLAVALAPFASSSPDGLQKVAEDKGFAGQARLHAAQQRGSPIPGYAFPGVADPRLATALAGLAGTLGVLAAGYGAGLVIRRRGRAS